MRAEAEDLRLSERTAWHLIKKFLAEPVRSMFQANERQTVLLDRYAEASDNIGSWPEAVNWLLRTYARDTYIQQEVMELRSLKQRDGETELEYYQRLVAKYSRLGGVYNQEDQILQ